MTTEQRNWQNFLSGKEFSNGELFRLKQAEISLSNQRIPTLTDYCSGKSVIHFGFADHLPLIEKKREDGVWLHECLADVATTLVGIDVNRAAVDYIKENIPSAECYCIDIVNEDLPDDITQRKWQVLLIGELLEHVDNPVEFLSMIARTFPNVDEFIITVPNAFCVTNFVCARGGNEMVNTDHRYWFSPFTLAKVCNRSGLDLVACRAVDPVMIGKGLLARFTSISSKKYPFLRETLVAVAKHRGAV